MFIRFLFLYQNGFDYHQILHFHSERNHRFQSRSERFQARVARGAATKGRDGPGYSQQTQQNVGRTGRAKRRRREADQSTPGTSPKRLGIGRKDPDQTTRVTRPEDLKWGSGRGSGTRRRPPLPGGWVGALKPRTKYIKLVLLYYTAYVYSVLVFIPKWF